MNVTPRPEVDRWLAQAREDLITAKVNLDAERFYAAALFAQQAAEKAPKAVIIHQTGKPAPKIHDIRDLGEMVDAPERLTPSLRQLVPAYLISRYPDASSDEILAEAYDETGAEELIQAAKEIVQWAGSQI